jgi:hypothetical protein
MMKRRLSIYVAAIAVVFACFPNAARVAVGAPAAATAPSTQPDQGDQGGPLKFYGVISAIDVQAKTFTVDNQTYNVVGETHMTKAADDSPAALADAVVGQPARGTYTRSSDGKLNVTKVRFGKKPGGAKTGGKGGGKKKDAAATAPSHDQ